MKSNESENNLLNNIRIRLDGEAENLDQRTVSALRNIRLEAIESAERKRGFLAIPRWLTAGGIATAVVAASVSMFLFTSQNSLPLKSPEELEMLSVNGQQELYSDLDFYRWLAEREDAG